MILYAAIITAGFRISGLVDADIIMLNIVIDTPASA
jgi:hypothetical protein